MTHIVEIYVLWNEVYVQPPHYMLHLTILVSIYIVFLLFSQKKKFSRSLRSLDCVLSSTYKCKHAMCFTNSIYIFFFHFWCHYP